MSADQQPGHDCDPEDAVGNPIAGVAAMASESLTALRLDELPST